MNGPFRFPWTRRPLAVAIVIAASWTGIAPASGLDLMPRSFSRSKQFVVYAQEGAVRGGVGALAEETKTGLLGALALRDDWQLPIVIDLRPPEPGLPDAAAPVRLKLGQTGTGLKIELDLLTGEAGRGTRIRDELVRAIVLELAYRDHPRLPAGRDYTLPPPWLVEGFSAFLENQEDGVSAKMFAALLPTTQAMSMTEFLGKDPAAMDSTSRAVYRAYSYNLICLLLRELNGGQAGLVAFIRDLPSTSPDDAKGAVALTRHFPELAITPDSLEKWWTLGLARLAEADRFQIFTVEESEEHLRALLALSDPGDPKKGQAPKTYAIGDFEEFTPFKRNEEILAPARLGLITLIGQSNPMYRQIVAGYQEVVAMLLRGKTAGVAEHLAALDKQRAAVLKTREEISDYMNWYEATQVSTQSGLFEPYFRAVRQLDAQKRVHRPDPISMYLDSLGTEIE